MRGMLSNVVKTHFTLTRARGAQQMENYHSGEAFFLPEESDFYLTEDFPVLTTSCVLVNTTPKCTPTSERNCFPLTKVILGLSYHLLKSIFHGMEESLKVKSSYVMTFLISHSIPSLFHNSDNYVR